nr:MAG: hypothetical protein [Narnaviridae sp.]
MKYIKMAPKRSQGKSAALKGQKQQSGQVMAPVAINRSYQQRASNQSIRIKETERIGTVQGSSSFAVVGNFPLNPGLPASFPWLSATASQYEKYRVHKIVYRYKNLKGTASDGNILMAFDFDSLDAPPSSAIQMTQYTRCTDGSPWRIFEMVVPTSGQELYTRSGIPAGSDLKTYDMGRLFVAAEGCADGSAHGYLEVEYDIELLKKQSPATGGVSTNRQVTFLSGTLSYVQNAAIGWVSNPTVTSNPIGATWTLAGVYTLPAGSYLVMIQSMVDSTAGSIQLWQNGSNTGISTNELAGQAITFTGLLTFSSQGTFEFRSTSTVVNNFVGQIMISLL